MLVSGDFQRTSRSLPLPSRDQKLESKNPTSSAAPVDGYQPASRPAGDFGLKQKDGRTLLVIDKNQLNKPFLLTKKTTRGVGELDLVGSEAVKPHRLVKLKRAGDKLQLVALQTKHAALSSSPEAKAIVDSSFAEGLLASAKFQIDEGRFVLDASKLLLNDFTEYAGRLNSRFDNTFSLDRENSRLVEAGTHQRGNRFTLDFHFKSGQVPSTRRPKASALPDSLLTQFKLDFVALPETPMKPRNASPHVGHFTKDKIEYQGDVKTEVSHIERWRVEKEDPKAQLSPVKDPIVISLEETVPPDFEDVVKEGILEWNKAFEAIGFENAIEVTVGETEETDATFGWHTADDRAYGCGVSTSDPRSGEILGGHIRMSSLFADMGRAFAKESNYLNPDSKVDEEKIAQDYVKHITTHEVGHLLGLLHNFKGSSVYTADQLADPEFTREHGIGSTVMEYLPFNFAGPNEGPVQEVMTSLGPYDYHAIKYAYQPVDPETESKELEQIAAEGLSNPVLAFETELVAYDGSDPFNSTYDLGNDPKAFALKQFGRLSKLQSLSDVDPAVSKEADWKLKKTAMILASYIGSRSIAEPEQKEALDAIVGHFFEKDAAFSAKDDVQESLLSRLLSSDLAKRITATSDDSSSVGLYQVYSTIQSAIFSELEDASNISTDRRELQRDFIGKVSQMLSADNNADGDARATARYLLSQLQQKLGETQESSDLSTQTKIHLGDCAQMLAKQQP